MAVVDRADDVFARPPEYEGPEYEGASADTLALQIEWQDKLPDPDILPFDLPDPDIAAPAVRAARVIGRAEPRGGLLVRRKSSGERVPIGSMGDGIWRLLGIALSLVRTTGGVLLIDEIDTGLHYTVIGKMWKLVMETAKQQDVQVFATTHSQDCYQSLAEICRADAGEPGEVSIQRIEKGKSHAVGYSEPVIIAAAKRNIEVR